MLKLPCYAHDDKGNDQKTFEGKIIKERVFARTAEPLPRARSPSVVFMEEGYTPEKVCPPDPVRVSLAGGSGSRLTPPNPVQLPGSTSPHRLPWGGCPSVREALARPIADQVCTNLALAVARTPAPSDPIPLRNLGGRAATRAFMINVRVLGVGGMEWRHAHIHVPLT